MLLISSRMGLCCFPHRVHEAWRGLGVPLPSSLPPQEQRAEQSLLCGACCVENCPRRSLSPDLEICLAVASARLSSDVSFPCFLPAEFLLISRAPVRNQQDGMRRARKGGPDFFFPQAKSGIGLLVSSDVFTLHATDGKLGA